ncbi:hypothetical protein LINPERPRIM_LOCUS1846 [Linum perenne]
MQMLRTLAPVQKSTCTSAYSSEMGGRA